MFERDNLTPITGININVRENHSIWSENTPYGVLGRIIIKDGFFFASRILTRRKQVFVDNAGNFGILSIKLFWGMTCTVMSYHFFSQADWVIFG